MYRAVRQLVTRTIARGRNSKRLRLVSSRCGCMCKLIAALRCIAGHAPSWHIAYAGHAPPDQAVTSNLFTHLWPDTGLLSISISLH